MQVTSSVRQPLVTGGKTYHDVTHDVSRQVEGKPSLAWFLAFLTAAGVLALGSIALIATLWEGIGMWGLNKTIGWAWDITNFVWWVGIGHAGTLISAVLLLFRQKWRTSINRCNAIPPNTLKKIGTRTAAGNSMVTTYASSTMPTGWCMGSQANKSHSGMRVTCTWIIPNAIEGTRLATSGRIVPATKTGAMSHRVAALHNTATAPCVSKSATHHHSSRRPGKTSRKQAHRQHQCDHAEYTFGLPPRMIDSLGSHNGGIFSPKMANYRHRIPQRQPLTRSENRYTNNRF